MHLTESSKSPASIAKSNKQWGGDSSSLECKFCIRYLLLKCIILENCYRIKRYKYKIIE